MNMIDPPSGWKYGFPKVCTAEEGEDIKEWLIKNGYPKKEIESCGKYFYCRFWEATAEKILDPSPIDISVGGLVWKEDK